VQKFFFLYLITTSLQGAIIEWVTPKDQGYFTEAVCEADLSKGFPHIVRYKLAKKGHEVVERTLKEAGRGDVVIWNRIGNRSTLKRISLLKKRGVKQVFIHFEPPMYDQFILFDLFDHVFTWDDSVLKTNRVHKFYYPVKNSMWGDLPTFNDRNLSAMVLSNHKSCYPNELYSKRRELVAFYESLPGGEFFFHLYGRKWGRDLKVYRGAPVDTMETLQGYRFGFVFENWLNDVGYITEKIFCAFTVGAVPVYLGSTNIANYIPEDCFIDARKFPSFQEIHDFLCSIKEERWLSYQESIRAYLESEQGALFSRERVATLFVEEILKSLEE